MKIFIMIFVLFILSLSADVKPIITDIWNYQTTDKTLTLENIKEHDSDFKKLDENSSFTSPSWIKIKFRDNLESGRYIVSYANIDFDLSSFSTDQQMHRFSLFGRKNISFIYHKEYNSNVYYIHLIPMKKISPVYLNVQNKKDFYTSLDEFFIYLLITGIVLGMITMTAIYNGALYYFNHEKSFLYYSLMQIFMVGVLFFHTGMPYALTNFFIQYPNIYEYFSLFTLLFGVLFTRSFLNTNDYLPRHDKVLLIFLALIILDMLYYSRSYFSDFGLYSIITIYFVVVGYFRMKQGYKPAIFFLIGWSALMIGLLIAEYFEEAIYFDTMPLGSTIEAILLAIALAYKVKQLQSEKEQQKELMIHQSKLASMGEMIGNIAHQWRQPLTHLSYVFMNIEELDDKKDRSKKVEEGTRQLEFMSQTIDDFKDFYKPNKEKEIFDIVSEMHNVLSLINFEDIKILFEKEENAELLNYKNEYKQVLLNLLSNAKEALILREIKDPNITIKMDKHEISIEDNAGGIEIKDIQKIFEPYFTTKESSSGIGLYMSKIIIEKNMGWKLSVENGRCGAIFKITIN